MDRTRITIPITTVERDALVMLARSEMRNARQQASIIIREELVRRGLLPEVDPQHTKGRVLPK